MSKIINPEVPDSLPSVAVIMCVYAGDSLAYFARAVDSVLSQEIESGWLVNLYLCVDGPVDDSIENYIVCNELKFHCLLRNTESKGLAYGLNRLLESIGKEPFIFRMDSDDVSEAERFKMQIEFMERECLDMCGTAIIEVDEDSTPLRVRRYPNTHAKITEMIHRGSPFAHPTICFSRSLLDKGLLRYDQSLSMSQDVSLWFALLAAGCRCGNLSDPLLRFQVSDALYRRRNYRKAWAEANIYLRGLRSLERPIVEGFFPLGRLLFRLLPWRVVKLAYNARFRAWILRDT